MRMRIRVGVVIATWEDSRLTSDCLDSLEHLQLSGDDHDIDLAIVVVDDASSAQSQQALRASIDSRADPRTRLVELERPGGYGTAANRGIAALAPVNPDFIWLLNNDVAVERGALLALVHAALAQPGVQVWGSTIVAGASGERLECAGGYRYSPLTTRNHAVHGGRRLSELGELEPGPMDYIAGAAMFFPAQALRAVGGLAEDYFLYFEEQDLVRRLPPPGRIAWCPASILFHEGGATTGGGRIGRSALQQYHENYSTLRFTARYFPLLLPPAFAARLLLKPCLFLWRREWHLYRPFFAALLDFLLGRPARAYRD